MSSNGDYNNSLIKAKLNQVAKKLGLTNINKRSTDRLPPGQYLTEQFPILDLGVRPPLDLKDIQIKVHGKINSPFTINYSKLLELESINITKDFHCVTKWSKYDLNWKGVPFSKIAQLAQPAENAQFVVIGGRDNYTTNFSLEELLKPDVIVAYSLENEDIPLLHGGPVRLIVPHLYGWKSAKFLDEIKFVTTDEQGFWETRGYHNKGDPWLEERYS